MAVCVLRLEVYRANKRKQEANIIKNKRYDTSMSNIEISIDEKLNQEFQQQNEKLDHELKNQLETKRANKCNIFKLTDNQKSTYMRPYRRHKFYAMG